MNNKKLMAIIEGILFIYGEEGISLKDLEIVLDNEKPSAITKAVDSLEEKYNNDDSSAFSIQKFGAHKYRLQTKADLYDWFAKLEIEQSKTRLSNSAIETLSIVAYKGPITKNDIDAIRGMDSSYQVYKLKERNLIRNVGKDKEKGNANLYSITENFFKLFNLVGGKEVLPQISDDEILEEAKKTQDDQNTFGKDIFGDYSFNGEE